jgi:ComF family protein
MVTGDQLICLDCSSSLPLTNFWLHAGNPVEKIFWGRLRIAAAASMLYFTKRSIIQNLLHELKYRGNKDVGRFLGRMMGEKLEQSERFKDVDVLVPLPLFYDREKKRGYNQAAVICDGMAETMNKPVLKNAMRRTMKTDTQTRKSRAERWTNIQGKFELTGHSDISDSHVLLVDDVITTGATLEACGAELLKAKNTRISIATLAYTTL